MLKLVSLIGARPQFIKASALSRALQKDSFKVRMEEILVHTGQHYDHNMSDIFFQELQIPFPKYNLNVGSLSHGAQTATMMQNLEPILIEENPTAVIVYGDTNSTLAGALTASKLHIPVVHIEAGLRSFNKTMPEEINRLVSDHVSTLLFTPTQAGMQNLHKEGFITNNPGPYTIDNPAVFHCGDIMFDNSLYFASMAKSKSSVLNDLKLEKDNFILVTIHRDSNTDNPKNLSSIMGALNQISQEHKLKIVLPLHPRTQKRWNEISEISVKKSIENNHDIIMIPAVSFLDIICLERNAKLIITDSGGVQKEACFFEKRCLVLREETEWVELLDAGVAKLVGASKEGIMAGFNEMANKDIGSFPQVYGDGKSAEFILKTILDVFSK